MTRITSIGTKRLRVPLSSPYHLSHTTIEHFEVILVEVKLADGGIGIGEVTPLPGYSKESADEAWNLIQEICPQLLSFDSSQLKSKLNEAIPEYPFTHSAVDCALETARRENIKPMTVPVVGILSTRVPSSESIKSLQAQINEGLDIIKVKIGFDADRDARRLNKLVKAAPNKIQFRVDANQGYTLADTRRFLDAAPLSRVQHIEQPLPVSDLRDCRKINEEYDVTVMLDEEIEDSRDLEAVSEMNAASRVKFKLMKAGGWQQTKSLIQQARNSGLDVVLGNGVQSDVACVHEALLWTTTGLSLAGEFNGWRKQECPLTDSCLEFNGGQLQWGGGPVSLSNDHVEPYLIQQRYFDD